MIELSEVCQVLVKELTARIDLSGNLINLLIAIDWAMRSYVDSSYWLPFVDLCVKGRALRRYPQSSFVSIAIDKAADMDLTI